LTGLSLYLYLPLRSALNTLPSWGAPQTLREFIWVITRESYRGMEPLFRNGSFYISFLKEYFRILSVYWVPGFIVLALIGLGCLWRQHRALLYSTLIFYAPVVLAVLAVPREETKFLMTVYLVPTQGLLAFWGFVGICFLIQKLFEFHFKFSVLALVVLFGAGLFWTFRVFKQEDKSRYYLASDFSLNALKLLPSKSIFLAEGDNYVVPLFYQRFVQGLRPDIVFVPSVFLFHNWGWNQLFAQDDRPAADVKTSHTLNGRMEALALAKGNGGLFNSLDQGYFGSAAINGDWTPWALEKLWMKADPRPEGILKKVLTLANSERFRGLETDYSPDDITTFEIHHYYANQYFSTGGWLREKGDGEDALRCFERGLLFYPQAAYAYAYMAAMVGSQGYLGLAEELCLFGIKADPGYWGSYENLANVYRQRGDYLKAQEVYQSGANYAHDREAVERQIKAMEKLYDQKPPRIVRDKSAGEYQALAGRYEKEGMVFLAALAGQIGQAGR
jgi:tetratricopeptide (TPR) repeat protein